MSNKTETAKNSTKRLCGSLTLLGELIDQSKFIVQQI